MIFICVGASEYQFNRLLKTVDELCNEGILDSNNIIAQIGNSSYKPSYRYFNSVSRYEFEKYIKEADYIISHAGAGCVVPSLKLNKKVILFPRLQEYKEHLDNHQLELCNVFTQNNYALCAKNKIELRQAINKIDCFSPNKFISNNNLMNELVIHYIEEVFI